MSSGPSGGRKSEKGEKAKERKNRNFSLAQRVKRFYRESPAGTSRAHSSDQQTIMAIASPWQLTPVPLFCR
jgi:hypothetical protein